VRVLPDLLPAFQTAAFVSNMVLTDEAMGMAARFDHYDDYVAARESTRPVYERRAEDTTDAALAWLALERDAARPLFLWVHYIDPHGPYRPPADWTIPFPPAEPRPIDVQYVPEHLREPGIADGNEYVRRYDAEIAYVDREVGRLLDGYARTRPVDQALVVLTADHGESMMEHERWFTHGYQVYDEIVHVPLLVRGPGVEPGRFATTASSIDVVPTVLRFAGIEPPAHLAGADLRRGSQLDPARTVYSEASFTNHQWRAARRGNEKVVIAVKGKGRTILEQRSYDLSADPHELSPGAPADAPGLLRDLLELVRTDPDPAGVPEQYQEGITLTAPKVAPGVSPEELERLKALGYAK